MGVLDEDTFIDKLVRFVFGAVVGAGGFFFLDLIHYFFHGSRHFKEDQILTAIVGVLAGIAAVAKGPPRA